MNTLAKILLTDDDHAITVLLRRVLVSEGHAVELAPDGVQGLALACARLRVLSGQHDSETAIHKFPHLTSRHISGPDGRRELHHSQ